jgi:hypothetical protein
MKNGIAAKRMKRDVCQFLAKLLSIGLLIQLK